MINICYCRARERAWQYTHLLRVGRPGCKCKQLTSVPRLLDTARRRGFYPANMGRRPNVGLLLGQRRRR